MYISRTNENEMNFKRKSSPTTVREIYTNLLYDNFVLSKYKVYCDSENELHFSKKLMVSFKYIKRPYHSLKTLFDVEVENNGFRCPKVSAVIIDHSQTY
jgi:hypothetical protein